MSIGRTIIASLILALPAAAQDTVDWAGTGCRMAMTPDKPHVAEIACFNRLTGGVTNNEGAVVIDGFQVGVIATMFPGDVPDKFEMVPPHGFVAVPPVMVLDEGAVGVVKVMEWVGF